MAESFEGLNFAHSSSQDLFKQEGVSAKFGLLLYRNFDSGNQRLTADSMWSSEEIKQFVESLRFPLVIEFDQEAAQRIFGEHKTSIFYFHDDFESQEVKDFREVAKSNQEKDLVFSISAVTKDFGKKLADFIGISESNQLRIVKFNDGDILKYKPAEGQSTQDFIDQFLAGSLSPFYKSAPVPESNDEPVKVVVGDNFEDLVFNSGKSVLLEAYAPWCGHCKKLEPIYKELAEKLQGNENVIIAKMDATANEHPSVQIKGFPTLFWFKPGSKSGEKYEGERSLEALMGFVQEKLGVKAQEADAEV